MLRFTIIAPDDFNETYLKQGVAEYVKRLSREARVDFAEYREARLPDSPSAGEIERALASESEKILAMIPRDAFVVALCIEGKPLSSEALADVLADAFLSHSQASFIIGSSHGLSAAVKARADLRLSFSALTFPHRLFRLMLMEAIYRSVSIMGGKKYHK